MIIENGRIEIGIAQGGGFDSNGYPVAEQNQQWSKPIPCQYFASQYDLQGQTAQGEAVVRSKYTILIEYQTVRGEVVRLTDEEGKEVGVYPIIQIEPLQAVQETRIFI